ncbi:MAG: PEP/pyruvate-binding domain-containing protein, partial [Myxococcota bacterium]|nr:PEP/pyruvate-binding domain-containing protein [Myxococcota bacterium]
MTTKYVYRFGGESAEGNASMKPLLGGKGAGLAEMSNLGLPVPPGFTVTTPACVHFFQHEEQWPESLWEECLNGVAHIEALT